MGKDDKATKDSELQCCACDNKLTFGGASDGIVDAYGGMAAVMGMMAFQAGWQTLGDEWYCRNHG